MRSENIKFTTTIPFPYDRPDGNGNIYTREAVESAVKNIKKNIPFVFMSKHGEEEVVGYTDSDASIIEWDDNAKTCNITVTGLFIAGGTGCSVYDLIEDGNQLSITNFVINKMGITEE